jgi:hypothetical protein
MPTDLTPSDRRALLLGAGFRAEYNEEEERWILYTPDGVRFNSTSSDEKEPPLHLFNPVEIDANFCFKWIVPKMGSLGYQFKIRIYQTGVCSVRIVALLGPILIEFDGEGPNIETAICRAFLLYNEENKA